MCSSKYYTSIFSRLFFPIINICSWIRIQNSSSNINKNKLYNNFKYENTEELEDIDKPTYEGMIEVISNIKNGKAPGIDNITVELIENGGPELLQRIFELLLQIWDQERMPEEWGKGIICPIFKKRRS